MHWNAICEKDILREMKNDFGRPHIELASCWRSSFHKHVPGCAITHIWFNYKAKSVRGSQGGVQLQYMADQADRMTREH